MEAVRRRCLSCRKPFRRNHPTDRRRHCHACRPPQPSKMQGGKPLPGQPNLGHLGALVTETAAGALKPAPRYLSTRNGKIIPDPKWPGMYRIQWRDGRLSDMVNYTRAADALREAP
jgi:hypothetical protein